MKFEDALRKLSELGSVKRVGAFCSVTYGNYIIGFYRDRDYITCIGIKFIKVSKWIYCKDLPLALDTVNKLSSANMILEDTAA